MTTPSIKRNWLIRFDEHAGYDMMTSGIDVGPALLDGRKYGQKSCEPLNMSQREAMFDDARLISGACSLVEIVRAFVRAADGSHIVGNLLLTEHHPLIQAARDVLEQIEG